MNNEILHAGKILWNYHQMHHQIHPADCILALGSHDLRVPERAADLYLQNLAPIVIMSGGLGNFTKEIWSEPEARKFARIAVSKGVPADSILIEDKSSNTGENILFTRTLLNEREIKVKKIIVVQKPYMERRSFATIRKVWPEPEIMVTSPQISFEDYPTKEIPAERVINIMVGDLQRIIEYPSKGFQVPQDVPGNVMQAFQFLKKEGFTKHLIKN